MVGRPGDLRQLIWKKILMGEPDECWEWRGARTRGGYGTFGGSQSAPGRRGYAARYVLEEKLGRPLLTGMETRHTCDNPPCCNPAHLVEGTSKTNGEDMVSRGRSNRGERHPLVKLTAEQVAMIRADPRSSPKVAPEYSVNPSTIRKIRRGERW